MNLFEYRLLKPGCQTVDPSWEMKAYHPVLMGFLSLPIYIQHTMFRFYYQLLRLITFNFSPWSLLNVIVYIFFLLKFCSAFIQWRIISIKCVNLCALLLSFFFYITEQWKKLSVGEPGWKGLLTSGIGNCHKTTAGVAAHQCRPPKGATEARYW